MKRTVILLGFLCGVVCLLIAPTSQAAGFYNVQMFDISGSISSTELGNAKGPAKLYVDLTPGSTARIKSFGNSTTNETGWTSDNSTLKTGIGNVALTSEATALYDALVDAANDLGAQAGATKRELICYTDLGNNNSTKTEVDVLNAMVNNVVTPYIIRYVEAPTGGAEADTIAADLTSIVEGRGGKVYVVSNMQDIQDALRDIANRPQVPALSPLGIVVLVGLLCVTALYLVARRRKTAAA